MTKGLASISARRPYLVVAIWLILAIIGGGLADDAGLGLNIGFVDLLKPATTTELTLGSGAESSRADKLLEEGFGDVKPIHEIVIVQSDSFTVDDPQFRDRVVSLAAEFADLGPETIASPPEHYFIPEALLPLLTPEQLAQREQTVSADRKTAIMRLTVVGEFDEALENVEPVLDIVRETDGKDNFDVFIIGDASISHEQNEIAEHDLRRGEQVGIPVALVILIVLFGTVVAALMPIVLALACIIVTLGITALIGQGLDLVFFIALMIIMIGLAVGIDYSLLVVSRFRDELDRGLDRQAAIERAGETAGRTVLFSGVTVVIALCGILIVPFGFFQSLGLGAILVVLVAMAGTLTLLPANLAIHGGRINKFPIPFFGRSKTSSAEPSGKGPWELLTRAVTRRPVISIIAIGAPMIAATVFYFQINTGLNGVDAYPEGAQTRDAFFVMEEHFSFGLVNPTDIVIDGDMDSPRVQGAIAKLQASLAGNPALSLDPGPLVNDDRDLARLTVFINGESRSRDAVNVIEAIRNDYVPDAFDGVDARVFVGGISAIAADVFSIVDLYTPIVFAFVLGFSFLVLMLVFRSIVIPVKAVFMNLLSVGAAYGLMVLVFQKGGSDLFGFQHAEVIEIWMPLFLFSILFGLSMDYHVFLLSRIRERYDQTGDNEEAVAYGLRSTASIITGAALIMVAVFGAFASGESTINQQMGFGLAVAIFLDATLVRSVLVPASMEVLGKRNWYLPSWLHWLPDLRVEPAEDEQPAPPPLETPEAQPR